MMTWLACWVVLAQDPGEELLKQHGTIETMVRRLEDKIVRLMETLEARGEKDRAERLKGAYARLKGDGLVDRLDLLKKEVERSNFAQAQEHADRAIETLREIVLILTQAADDTLADIEWLEAVLERVRKLIPRQKETRDAGAQESIEKDTREIQRDLGRRGFDELSELGARAAEAMRRSNDDFRRRVQSEAKEGLEQLAKGIQETIDRLKGKLHAQERIRLTEELRQILEAEKTIRLETSELGEFKGMLDRRQTLQARRLANDQGKLHRKMEEIRKAVALENADVFEFVIDRAMEEMSDIAARLSEADVSRPVQDLEDSVIRRLEDLLEAWTAPEGAPRAGGTPGSGSPSEPALVPDVVQLSLMKRLQEAILQKTVRARTEAMPEELQRRAVRRLSEEQRKLADLMGGYIRRFGGR